MLHIRNVKWRKLHATGHISHVVWHFRANNKCDVQHGAPLGVASCAFFYSICWCREAITNTEGL